LLTVLLTGFVYANQDAKVAEQLKTLVQQMVDAQRKFDQAALNNILAPDYIEISPVGEFDSREKVIGFYDPKANEGKTDSLTTAAVDEYDIRIYGETAVVIARITYAPKAVENQPARPPIGMRITIVCRKNKGKWQIASTQYTGIRPPRPQQQSKTE
jgi:uncharacterized protein (TIGR02246 family)